MVNHNLKDYIIRLIQYVVFWVTAVWLSAGAFAYGNTIEKVDWIYTLHFMLSVWFGVLVNSFLLIPRFLAKNRRITYIIFLLVLLEVCIQINHFTFESLSGFLFPDYFFVSYYNRLELFYFHAGFLGLTSLLQFSRSWFNELKLKNELAEMQQQKATHELQALKHNIQPHFLFNSLNAIYMLTKKGSDSAAEAVLKLSDLLRYTIKQSEKNEVELSEEVAYIENYINLQKLRMNNPNQVLYNVEGDFKGINIIPLILIVFVENCFKYADFDSREPIIIDLKATESEIYFMASNPSVEHSITSGLPDNRQGTGISNVQKRLELHYPDRHKLDITKNPNKYQITLVIKRPAL